jgi:hypothetical protein
MVAISNTALKPSQAVGAGSASTSDPTQSAAFEKDAQTAYNDINSGNYAGAWSAALATSPMFGTNYNSATKDPLLDALETSQGLQAFDPTKKWNSSSINAYYQAFGANPVFNGNQGSNMESLGKNPYGQWGSGSAVTSGHDAQVNEQTQGDNSAPDIARFAGQRPTQSFLSKYGGTLATIAGDIGGSFIGDPVLGNQVMAAYDATQGNWAGAAGNLASSLTPGLGQALGSATGLSNVASGALVGGGLGAATAGISGGNPLLGALGGAASGAIGNSGIKAGVSGAVGGGVLGNVAGSVVQGGLKLGAGMAVGALGSAMTTQPAAKSTIQPTGNLQSSVPTSALAPSAGGAQPVGVNITGGAVPTAQQGPIAAQQNNTSSLLGGLAIGGGIGALGSVLSGNGNSANTGVGNIGSNSMASSTDTSLASTITGALPGLLQGAAGVYGAQNAAQAMTQADANAIATQQSTLGNINNIWSTQQQLGQGADTALGSALGTNGQPANYSNFENMPGYQFAVQQGTQAIQRQAAAMGSAYTPNTAAAVGQYVTGTASQDYNTYISQLMGAAGLGTTANQGIATPTYQTGANISTLQQNQGYAQASGVSGSANAIGGLFGANGAGTSLLGGGGSSGGGGGGGGGSGGSGAVGYGPTPGYNGSGVYSAGATGGGSGVDDNGNFYDSNGNLLAAGETPDMSSLGNLTLPDVSIPTDDVGDDIGSSLWGG